MDDDGWEVVDGAGGGGGGESGGTSLGGSDVTFYRKTFGLPDETPVHRAVCSADGTKGWLYLSRRHVCFAGLLGQVRVLALRDVEAVALEGARLGHSVLLRLAGGRACTVYAPVGGTALYEALQGLWRRAREQEVALAEGHERSDVPDLLEARRAAAAAALPFHDAAAERAYRVQVHDPAWELAQAAPATLVLEGAPVAGTLYCGPALLFEAPGLRWRAHVLQLVAVEAEGPLLRLRLTGGVAVLLGVAPLEAQLVRGLWRAALERQAVRPPPAAPPAATARPGFTQEMVQDPRAFSPGYAAWAAGRAAAWGLYLERFGRGSGGRAARLPPARDGRRLGPAPLRKEPEWSELVRGGIPDELRAEVWLHGSGAALLQAGSPGLYAELVAAAAARECVALRDISKDVERTMPTHPHYQTPEGLASLQRVLGCYALHNPQIGYTQSMNFLSALFLLYMDEEAAFFLLAMVVEHLAPQAYRKSLVGSVAQLAVLDRLLSRFCPALAASLAERGFGTSMVATGWLMCLFVTFLPWEATLRVLDYFLCCSPLLPLRVALALFALNENRLLECDAIEDILAVLGRRDYAVEELLTTALCLFDLSDAELEALLAEETARAMRSAAAEGEARQLASAAGSSHLGLEEMRALYGRFCAALPPDAAAGTLAAGPWSALLAAEAPRCAPALALLAWERAAAGGHAAGFAPLAEAVSALTRAPPPERLLFCLRLFEQHGAVDAAGVLAAVRALLASFGVSLEPAEAHAVARAAGAGPAEAVCRRILAEGLLSAHLADSGAVASDVGDFEIV